MSSQENDDATRRSNERFWAMQRRLERRLYVEIDDAFLDRKHRCVSLVALVVSLSVQPFFKETPRSLQQTLDAVATLCAWSESLRSDKDQFDAFWIQSTLKCLHAVGFHVRVTWQGEWLQPFVIEAIRAFLHTPRAKYERRDLLDDGAGSCRPRVVARPLQVEIELSDCQMNEADFKRLLEALRVRPEDPHAGATLCERGVLWGLRLTGIYFDTAELNALAKILEAPSTRRIDSLGLIDVIPLEDTVAISKPYTKAFKRVMMAAFRFKIAAHQGHGFALSLAKNDGLRADHIVALQETLAGSGVTRPLRFLSFADIAAGYDSTWVQIGKLLFDRSAAQTDMNEYQLILSATAGHARIVDRLAQLVRAATPQVRRALHVQVTVYCRVLGRTSAAEGLSRSTLYQIVGVSATTDHSFSIQVPRASIIGFGNATHADSVLLRWVTADEISCIRIGDTDMIRSRLNSLVFDSNRQYGAPPPNLLLLQAMGPDLKRLALRKHFRLYSYIAPVLACCPRLEELNLNHSMVEEDKWRHGHRLERADTLWAQLTHANWCSLQAVSLVGLDLPRGSFTALKALLADIPDRALQHLCLSKEHQFTVTRLSTLSDILDQNRGIQEITIGCSSLKFDEARGMWQYESAENAALRAQIDQQLRVEGHSVESRLAFLSVLPRLATPLQQNLDNGVVAEIFKFANAQKPRVVTWC